MDLSEFIDLLVSYFAGNLRAVLQYGSSTTSTHPADIDILVVLQHKGDTSSDLRLLKKIERRFREIYFDLQLMYSEEITDVNNFSLDSHGCFIALVLKRANVLWGHNPFVDATPDREEVKKSIVRKLQYYIFRARQMFLGEPYRSKDKSRDFHRKKLLMAIVSLLLFNNSTLYTDPLKEFIRRHPECLTGVEADMLRNRVKPLSITLALPIYEKLYNLALELTKKSKEHI